jgi:hypothetical protein
MCLPSYAQSGVRGTWQAVGLGPQPWTVVLRAEEGKLTGSVSSCASISVDIFDGTIAGNTITFKCQSLDGDRIISFRGVVNGDEIAFTWAKQVRDGSIAVPPEGSEATPAKGTFGSSTPSRFIAKRVEAGRVEFGAVVHLAQRGVKVDGTLLLPSKGRSVRSAIVVINYGLGNTFYFDEQLQDLVEPLEAGLLHVRISNMEQVPIDVVRNAGLVEATVSFYYWIDSLRNPDTRN